MTEFKLQDIVSLFQLEQLEENIFRGQSQWTGRNVFGGQVIGQALLAASRTVPDDRPAHSLHAYFLRPGNPDAPIVYHIERIRDGRSFTTRLIVAVQFGEPIFNMSASFQVHEDGFEHQAQMPDVPQPEHLETELQLRDRIKSRVPERWHHVFMRPRPVEMRPVDPVDLISPEPQEARRNSWIRVPTRLDDDPKLHQALLAYASDMNLMGTAMLPHAISYMTGNVFGASLDHAMWFHQSARMDEWVLYTTDSPVANNARGLNRGMFFNREGDLIASTIQEGLMRLIAKKAP